jgi:hypothetical protein
MSITGYSGGRSLRPPDHPENQGYNGNYQQNVDQSAYTVNEETEDPTYDQNNSNDVQQASHNFNLKVK